MAKCYILRAVIGEDKRLGPSIQTLVVETFYSALNIGKDVGLYKKLVDFNLFNVGHILQYAEYCGFVNL